MTAYRYADSLDGNGMFCGGVYDKDDTSVAAVSPTYYDAWPCGTSLQVCGPADCINVRRQDSCPGCGDTEIDLSRAGVVAVCGAGKDTCSVQVSQR